MSWEVTYSTFSRWLSDGRLDRLRRRRWKPALGYGYSLASAAGHSSSLRRPAYCSPCTIVAWGFPQRMGRSRPLMRGRMSSFAPCLLFACSLCQRGSPSTRMGVGQASATSHLGPRDSRTSPLCQRNSQSLDPCWNRRRR
jgi:hypothetical protein